MAYLYSPGSERWISQCTDSSGPPTQPSVTSRGKSIAPGSWPRVWRTKLSASPLCGAISFPSMAAHIAAVWISLRPHRLASLTLSPAASEATVTSEPSRLRLSESSASVSPASSSSSAPQPTSSTSSPSGESFEAWVSTLRRPPSFPRRSVARRISAGDSLFLLPTPTAQRYGSGQNGNPHDNRTEYKGKRAPSLDTLVQQMPTPGAHDWKGSSRPGQRRRQLDEYVENLPTPTAGAVGYSAASGRHSGQTLTDVACGAATTARRGRLSPQFSGWMMDLPIGWTALEPLETPSSPHK